MSSTFRRFAEIILNLRWPIFLVFTLSTLFLVLALPQLKIDPSTETLFEKNSEDYRFYQDFRNHFGSDSLVAIAIDTPSGYLTYENLKWTKALTTVLSSDSRVDRVISLTNAMDIRHRMIGVKVEPVIAGVLEKEKPFDVFKKEVLSNPFVQGNLISKDGKAGAILVRLKAGNPNSLKGYVSELRTLFKFFPWPRAKFYLAGSPVEQHDFVSAIRRDQMFFIPSVTLLLILSSYLIYRNFPSVIVAMSIVFMTLLWTFGTIALLGHSLNLVNSLLAPVVMIISVPNAIYLINLFSELRSHHSSVRECTRLTLQYLGVPCFLTSATVMVGFLSLAFNPVPAVKEFGLFAALGSFYSYVIAMTLTPLLLPILPFRKKAKDEGNHFFNRVIVTYLEKIDFGLKWLLLVGAGVLVFFSFVGIRHIRIDTNLIHDLRQDSPIAEATRFIDQKLTGVYSLGISVRRKDNGPVTGRDAMEKVDRLSKFLESQSEITKVNSLAMIIKKVHEAREGDPKDFRIPKDEGTLRSYIRHMAESDNPDFWSFISKDFRQTRLEARMKAVGTQRGKALESRIWDYVHRYLSDDYDVRITGNVVLLGKMSERLVEDQVKSVGIAFVVILILISLFFRSWKMGLLASIPNLLPIVALYGLMGFLKIDLSTPTAMISSVVLGLVVDASIQFLYRFRHEFERRGHYLQALHHTYRNVGQAMVVSTLILVFGFASSAFASFRPTVYFGILTSVTILFALVCTLVLLPVALILLRPFGKQKVLAKGSKQFLTVSHGSPIIGA